MGWQKGEVRKLELDFRRWRQVTTVPVVKGSHELRGHSVDVSFIWSTQRACLLKRQAGTWAEIPAEKTLGTLMRIASRGIRETARPAASRRPFFTFISDDGALADFSRLGPLAERKRCPFVLAIVRNYVGTSEGVGYMDVPHLQAMSTLGCEIVGHSVNHLPIARLRPPHQCTEIEGCIHWLRDHGWNARHFVYPYGSHDISAERIVGEVCNAACIVTGGVARPPFLRTRLPRWAFGSFFHKGVRSFEDYRRLADQAIGEKRLLIWMLHPWSEEHDASQHDMLADLIDYVRDKGAIIGTLSDALAEHGNLFETGINFGGEWILDCDGALWTASTVGVRMGDWAEKLLAPGTVRAFKRVTERIKRACSSDHE